MSGVVVDSTRYPAAVISMVAGPEGAHLALFAAVVVETVFPPLAGPTMPLAGARAAGDPAALTSAVVVTTVASTTGSLLLYHCARAVGADRVRAALLRHSASARLRDAHFDSAEAWFRRHADTAVLFGRCVPVIRSLVSLPAGLERMNWVRFTVLTTIGNLIWCTTMVLAGALLGEGLPIVHRWTNLLIALLVAVWSAVFVAMLWRHLRRRREAVASDRRREPA